MKKILVTGASGFIGSHLIPALLSDGHTVIATSTNITKIKEQEWFSKVQYLPFDFKIFSAEENYYDYFGQPDLLIHLAWEGLPNYKSLFHFEENLPRHYFFLKNLIQRGLTDILVTGTCFEYGFQEGCLQEDMTTAPDNPYAIAKDSLHKFLRQLKYFHPFVLRWVRLFYMYGKGQNPASLFSQLDKTIKSGATEFNMSAGEQVRDYLPIEKVVQYIKAIALQQDVTGAINCCSGKPIKLKDLVTTYLQERGATIKLNLGYYPYPDYEPMSFWGDNTKLKTILKEGTVNK